MYEVKTVWSRRSVTKDFVSLIVLKYQMQILFAIVVEFSLREA